MMATPGYPARGKRLKLFIQKCLKIKFEVWHTSIHTQTHTKQDIWATNFYPQTGLNHNSQSFSCDFVKQTESNKCHLNEHKICISIHLWFSQCDWSLSTQLTLHFSKIFNLKCKENFTKHPGNVHLSSQRFSGGEKHLLLSEDLFMLSFSTVLEQRSKERNPNCMCDRGHELLDRKNLFNRFWCSSL